MGKLTGDVNSGREKTAGSNVACTLGLDCSDGESMGTFLVISLLASGCLSFLDWWSRPGTAGPTLFSSLISFPSPLPPSFSYTDLLFLEHTLNMWSPMLSSFCSFFLLIPQGLAQISPWWNLSFPSFCAHYFCLLALLQGPPSCTAHSLVSISLSKQVAPQGQDHFWFFSDSPSQHLAQSNCVCNCAACEWMNGKGQDLWGCNTLILPTPSSWAYWH